MKSFTKLLKVFSSAVLCVMAVLLCTATVRTSAEERSVGGYGSSIEKVFEDGSFYIHDQISWSPYQYNTIVIGADMKEIFRIENEWKSVMYMNGYYVVGNALYSAKGKLLHTFKDAVQLYIADDGKILYLMKKEANFTSKEKYYLVICNKKYKQEAKINVTSSTEFINSLSETGSYRTAIKVAKGIYYIGTYDQTDYAEYYSYFLGGNNGNIVNTNSKKVIAAPFVLRKSNGTYYCESLQYGPAMLSDIKFSKIKKTSDFEKYFTYGLKYVKNAKYKSAFQLYSVANGKIVKNVIAFKEADDIDITVKDRKDYSKLWRSYSLTDSTIKYFGVDMPYVNKKNITTSVVLTDTKKNIVVKLVGEDGANYITVVNSKGKMLYNPVKNNDTVIGMCDRYIILFDGGNYDQITSYYVITPKGETKKLADVAGKMKGNVATGYGVIGKGNKIYVKYTYSYTTYAIISLKDAAVLETYEAKEK